MDRSTLMFRMQHYRTLAMETYTRDRTMRDVYGIAFLCCVAAINDQLCYFEPAPANAKTYFVGAGWPSALVDAPPEFWTADEKRVYGLGFKAPPRADRPPEPA